MIESRLLLLIAMEIYIYYLSPELQTKFRGGEYSSQYKLRYRL